MYKNEKMQQRLLIFASKCIRIHSILCFCCSCRLTYLSNLSNLQVAKENISAPSDHECNLKLCRSKHSAIISRSLQKICWFNTNRTMYFIAYNQRERDYYSKNLSISRSILNQYYTAIETCL